MEFVIHFSEKRLYSCEFIAGRMGSSQDDLDDDTCSLYSPSSGKTAGNNTPDTDDSSRGEAWE